MIDAKELRIGNWVDGTSYVPAIDNMYYQIRKEHFSNTNFTITKPIPLTTEILEKCGFEKCLLEGLGDYQILCGKGTHADGLFLIIDMEDFSFVVGQLKHFSHAFGEYKYLHQLQNLYYCLTGKELEIKL